MPLRTPNAPFTAAQVLAAMGAVMLPNTQLQAAGGSVLVNTDQPLIDGTGSWPALILAEAQPSTGHIGLRLWQDRLVATIIYCDVWESDAAESLDAIWARIDLDLRRMMANLQDNPALIVSGTRYLTDLPQLDLSPYATKQLDDKTYGKVVVQRVATAHLNLLPYVAAT